MARLNLSLRTFFGFARRPARQTKSTGSSNTKFMNSEIENQTPPQSFIPSRPTLRKSDSQSQSTVYTLEGIARERRSVYGILELPSQGSMKDGKEDEQDSASVSSSSTLGNDINILGKDAFSTYTSPLTTYTYFPDPQVWSSPASESESEIDVGQCIRTDWTVQPRQVNLYSQMQDIEEKYMDARYGQERIFLGLELAVVGVDGMDWC